MRVCDGAQVVNKSKKAKEVEALVQENEHLQRKLQSQEDEFRLQNVTLMKELGQVSRTDWSIILLYTYQRHSDRDPHEGTGAGQLPQFQLPLVDYSIILVLCRHAAKKLMTDSFLYLFQLILFN